MERVKLIKDGGQVINPALAEHADAIRSLGKRVIGDVIEIGERLAKCKRIAGHDNWLPWLEREFGWTEQTALNFMRVHQMAESESKNFLDLSLPVSALYLLAAPSTPKAARTEIIARAEAGEKLSVAEVKSHIDKHKPIRRQSFKRSGLDAVRHNFVVALKAASRAEQINQLVTVITVLGLTVDALKNADAKEQKREAVMEQAKAMRDTTGASDAFGIPPFLDRTKTDAATTLPVTDNTTTITLVDA